MNPLTSRLEQERHSLMGNINIRGKGRAEFGWACTKMLTTNELIHLSQ